MAASRFPERTQAQVADDEVAYFEILRALGPDERMRITGLLSDIARIMRPADFDPRTRALRLNLETDEPIPKPGDARES